MRDKVIDLVKQRGPLLPIVVSKALRIDTIIASAYLAELVSSKRIFISHTKVGGSPVYYFEGQETQLQDLKEHLSEKEQKAFDLLKKEKVLQDSELSPLMRVEMRSIKDFAVPLKVNKTEIFWKWYLMTNEEAIEMIKQKMKQKEVQVKEKPKVSVKIKEPEKPKLEAKAEPKVEVKEEKKEDKKEEIKEKKEPETKVKKKKEEKKEEKQKVLEVEERRFESIEEFKKYKEDELKKKEDELRKLLEKERMMLEQEFKIKEEEMKRKKTEEEKRKLEEEKRRKEEEERKEKESKDPFLAQIKTYFETSKITIENVESIKLGKELDFTIWIPTAVGEIRYYCKAKDKKKVNDGDLSTAYLKGQSMSLPTLFLTTGEVVKHATEMIGKEFKQLIVKKL